MRIEVKINGEADAIESASALATEGVEEFQEDHHATAGLPGTPLQGLHPPSAQPGRRTSWMTCTEISTDDICLTANPS